MNVAYHSVVPLKQIDGPDASGSDDVVVVEPKAKDKYQLVYVIFLLHGIGILMPWNMFITAHGCVYFVLIVSVRPSARPPIQLSLQSLSSVEKCGFHFFSYFIDYKLRGPCDQPESEYRKFFMNYLGIVAQLPNVLLNLINLFVHLGGNIKSRLNSCHSQI